MGRGRLCRARCVRLVGRVVREEGRRLCGERPSSVSTPFSCPELSGPALWSESALSQAFLVGVSLGSEAFWVGVSWESALSGRSGLLRSEVARSWRSLAGAGRSGRSQLGVSAFRLESAWSQRFLTGVSRSSWSQRGVSNSARSTPERAEAGWSQPLQLAPARSGSLHSGASGVALERGLGFWLCGSSGRWSARRVVPCSPRQALPAGSRRHCLSRCGAWSAVPARWPSSGGVHLLSLPRLVRVGVGLSASLWRCLGHK